MRASGAPDRCKIGAWPRCFTVEEGDALDVRRVREHVDRAGALHRVAAVHEGARVRGQRGRIARHVDDPLRRQLEQPLQRLRREARPGRVDEDHVGPGRALEQRRDALGDVTRDELDVRDAVSLGVLAGPGDRLLGDLDPEHPPGAPGGEQADRAGTAVEIPGDVRLRERGVLDRELVQPLAHDGVRLHERSGRDGKPQPADELLVAVGAEERDRLEPGGRLGDARIHGVRDADDALRHERLQRVRLRHGTRRRDEHRKQLPGVRTLADDEVAQVALAGPPVVDREPAGARPPLEGPAHVVSGRRRDVARLDRHQLIPPPGPVKPERRPLGPRRPRVLELVAVAVLLGRGHDRLERHLEPAEATQSVVDLGRLVANLLGVVEVLPRAATADAEVRAARLHPAGAGLQELDRAGLGVAALQLRDARPHAVARKRTRDEDHQLAVPGDAAAAVGEGVDGEVDLLTAMKGDGHG